VRDSHRPVPPPGAVRAACPAVYSSSFLALPVRAREASVLRGWGGERNPHPTSQVSFHDDATGTQGEGRAPLAAAAAAAAAHMLRSLVGDRAASELEAAVSSTQHTHTEVRVSTLQRRGAVA
jgi:hypothetical protein